MCLPVHGAFFHAVRFELSHGRAALIARVHAPVARRKVTSQITAIMKDAGDFDNSVLAAAIEEEVARLIDLCAGRSGPAERNVVSPRPFDHEFGTFLRAWPLRIGFDIE